MSKDGPRCSSHIDQGVKGGWGVVVYVPIVLFYSLFRVSQATMCCWSSRVQPMCAALLEDPLDGQYLQPFNQAGHMEPTASSTWTLMDFPSRLQLPSLLLSYESGECKETVGSSLPVLPGASRCRYIESRFDVASCPHQVWTPPATCQPPLGPAPDFEMCCGPPQFGTARACMGSLSDPQPRCQRHSDVDSDTTSSRPEWSYLNIFKLLGSSSCSHKLLSKFWPPKSPGSVPDLGFERTQTCTQC